VRGQATTKNESQAMCILRGGRSFIKSWAHRQPQNARRDNAKVGDKIVMYIQNRNTIIALF
jgi:hypothetical protein